MKEVTGNLVSMLYWREFDIGVHGCNCFHRMKSGIAKEMVETFPEVAEVDIYGSIYGNKDKLGSFTRRTFSHNPLGDVTIINAYTQFTYSRTERVVEYEAIRNVFRRIKRVFGGEGLTFGIPKIGAGLAGGDWKVISQIIEEEMEGEDLTLVVLW